MESLLDAEAAYDDEVIGDTTLARTFEDAAARHESRTAQFYKGDIYPRSFVDGVVRPAPEGDFRSLQYGDMREIVRNLATGFRSIGLEADDRVAIFAHTRMEWAQADYAVLAAGGVVTTVYPTSSTSQVGYLLDHPGATGAIVENATLLERVLAVEDDLPDLGWLVVIDDLGDHPAGDRDDVHTLAAVHDRGAASFDPAAYRGWIDERSLEDLASVIYTSGTTGRPKGVRLTHGNFRANLNQVRRRFGPRPDLPAGTPAITEETRVVSYLPLAHVFERLAGHFLMFASGASVAYAETPDTLREDFNLVEPTSATSVPRVYEQIYKAIREQAESSRVRGAIFQWATDVGRAYQRVDDPGAWLRLKRAVADRLVFSKVHEGLGGQLEFLISGGGSLSPELAALYHGMGLPILEGYGLTETAPVLTANPPQAPRIGTIGPPVVDVETDLDTAVAVPDGVNAAGPVGELLVRGPNVTPGYLDNAGANDRAFTGEGWFRTGDLVTVRPDGYVAFVERLKELLVLSTGKNVAPVPIEDAFATSRLVEQVMAVGDERPFVAALVVPSEDGVARWAADEGLAAPADRAELCAFTPLRDAIGAEVERVNGTLERYERVREFTLVPEAFTEEADLLTPTMKKKRRNIHDRYAAEVEAMYAED